MRKDLGDTPGQKVIKLNPGDIVTNRSIEGRELGRYIVLTKHTQGVNATYYYVEYTGYVLYGVEENYISGYTIPGQTWIIDSINLLEGEEWEIVSQSGLSWDDPDKSIE